MATAPYFILSPSTILSLLGLMRGPDPTTPTPAEDWRDARVDVIIPAFNEEQTIMLCLASVLRQTLRPRRILLIDDGSSDKTVERAEMFCAYHGVEFTAIRRRKPIGKTPTIKRQARELDSDVEFILDGDTVLESNNYIERTVQELYQAVGIASTCGTILPMREKDRKKFAHASSHATFLRLFPPESSGLRSGPLHRVAQGITNVYRDVLYTFLQRFVYRGQIVFFGTTSNPVGCAVAYRRRYVERLFDHFGPLLGDDLTNSEDIFIGLAMLNEGYRNIHLTDVLARTVEPEIHRLPRQVYLWSSAFLQSCYYFDDLVRGPIRALRRAVKRAHGPHAASAAIAAASRAMKHAEQHVATTAGRHAGNLACAGSPVTGSVLFQNGIRPPDPIEGVLGLSAATDMSGRDRRVIQEPYRQAFGRDVTARLGRPAGWILVMSAVEKVFFPCALVMMILLRNWHGLAITVCAETLIGLFVLTIAMKGRRLEYFAKGLAIAPLRYALMITELVTIGRFAVDLWFTNNRNWRK
jgi:glycosyltransferase involved in cell wall biosynthesis